jgi:2-polyprenyl-3-methyl-5-hydroxy-6-metoxy-1,4-benzoquinol methylase
MIKLKCFCAKYSSFANKVFLLSIIIVYLFNLGAMCSQTGCNNNTDSSKYLTNIRSELVQTAIDCAYSNIRNALKWNFNGSDEYHLMHACEAILLSSFAANPISSIVLMDIGGGDGSWALNMVKLMQKEKFRGKKIDIYTITGGRETKSEICKKCPQVTLHFLNEVKIENIDKELEKRNCDLKNQANLIVSSKTMRHLVDPIGTLKKIVTLLNPKGGIFMSDGFLFKFEHSDKVQTFPWNNEFLVKTMQCGAIFRKPILFSSKEDYGDFIIVRDESCALSTIEREWEYTSKVISFDKEKKYDCISKKLTEFKQLANKPDTDCFLHYHKNETIYFFSGNQENILYHTIFKNGFLSTKEFARC